MYSIYTFFKCDVHESNFTSRVYVFPKWQRIVLVTHVPELPTIAFRNELELSYTGHAWGCWKGKDGWISFDKVGAVRKQRLLVLENTSINKRHSDEWLLEQTFGAGRLSQIVSLAHPYLIHNICTRTKEELNIYMWNIPSPSYINKGGRCTRDDRRNNGGYSSI